jgi:hypothetical protein
MCLMMHMLCRICVFSRNHSGNSNIVAHYIYLQNADRVCSGPLLCDFRNLRVDQTYGYEAKFSFATFSFMLYSDVVIIAVLNVESL